MKNDKRKQSFNTLFNKYQGAYTIIEDGWCGDGMKRGILVAFTFLSFFHLLMLRLIIFLWKE
jgi:hypothetical protein